MTKAIRCMGSGVFGRRLLGLVMGFGVVGIRAEPELEFRLLRTDARTGPFIRKALVEGDRDAAAFASKLDELTRGGRVEALAVLSQPLANEAKAEFIKDPGVEEVADGENHPVGLRIEVQGIVREGWADLQVAFEDGARAARNRIDVDGLNATATLRADRWELVAGWGDKDAEKLLLAKVSGDGGADAAMDPVIGQVYYDFELREASAADLRTFGGAKPEQREKAVEWLRGRSQRVGGGQARAGVSDRTVFQDVRHWLHEDDGAWDTANLGLTLDLVTQIGPEGRQADVVLAADWQPLDARRPPAEPQFIYRASERLGSGATIVVAPQGEAEGGTVPVLMLTATLTREGGRSKAWEQGILPPEGQIGVRSYRVQPDFLRTVAGREPGEIAPPGNDLAGQLARHGLEFPEGTRVSFLGNTCEVVLQHERQGHAKFEEILKTLGLAYPGAEDAAR